MCRLSFQLDGEAWNKRPQTMQRSRHRDWGILISHPRSNHLFVVVCPKREVTNESLIIAGVLNLQTTTGTLWWLQLHGWTNLRGLQALRNSNPTKFDRRRATQQRTMRLTFRLRLKVLREERGDVPLARREHVSDLKLPVSPYMTSTEWSNCCIIPTSRNF